MVKETRTRAPSNAPLPAPPSSPPVQCDPLDVLPRARISVSPEHPSFHLNTPSPEQGADRRSPEPGRSGQGWGGWLKGGEAELGQLVPCSPGTHSVCHSTVWGHGEVLGTWWHEREGGQARSPRREVLELGVQEGQRRAGQPHAQPLRPVLLEKESRGQRPPAPGARYHLEVLLLCLGHGCWRTRPQGIPDCCRLLLASPVCQCRGCCDKRFVLLRDCASLLRSDGWILTISPCAVSELCWFLEPLMACGV